jgi:hydroxymethylpyrimidine/phosphomethylpyrimidine kinase
MRGSSLPVYCGPMLIAKALTIAGSDSGGGAGIQADLKTFSAFRVFGMSVITAVTAQNSMGVQAVENLPPAFVAQELRSVLSDFDADAAKCGMLSTAAIIEAVAAELREHPIPKLVVDPVMVATARSPSSPGSKEAGDRLLQPDARETLVKRILPLALLVTPNLPEAEALAGMPVHTRADMEEAARRIHALGPRYVLVKGGHLKGDALDLLWNGRELTAFSAPRIESKNTHGTGCTLSAAIAAGLARGQALGDSVRSAKAYVTKAIREGFALGRGVGQLRHFLAEW